MKLIVAVGRTFQRNLFGCIISHSLNLGLTCIVTWKLPPGLGESPKLELFFQKTKLQVWDRGTRSWRSHRQSLNIPVRGDDRVSAVGWAESCKFLQITAAFFGDHYLRRLQQRRWPDKVSS
jgi:hypothetical protein